MSSSGWWILKPFTDRRRDHSSPTEDWFCLRLAEVSLIARQVSAKNQPKLAHVCCFLENVPVHIFRHGSMLGPWKNPAMKEGNSAALKSMEGFPLTLQPTIGYTQTSLLWPSQKWQTPFATWLIGETQSSLFSTDFRHMELWMCNSWSNITCSFGFWLRNQSTSVTPFNICPNVNNLFSTKQTQQTRFCQKGDSNERNESEISFFF